MSRLEELHQAAVKAEQERLDREAIAHLDWDHEPKCQTYFMREGVRRDCPSTASWRMFCRGCGFLALVCGSCRDRHLLTTTPRMCTLCRQYALPMLGWAFEPLARP